MKFFICIIVVLLFGCSDDLDGNQTWRYGPSVTYGNEIYETVVIGSQTWLKRNLNYNAEGSSCYDDEYLNCERYGRIYPHSVALNICPSGYRLPSPEDWETLFGSVGGLAQKLFDPRDWVPCRQSGAGCSDVMGFSAKPGGYYSSGYKGIGESSMWHTSSNDPGKVTYMGQQQYFFLFTMPQAYVRCVKM